MNEQKKAEQERAEGQKKKRKPRRGSEAWFAALRQDPAWIRQTVLDLARQAAGGSKVALELLLGWLAEHPEMRALVRDLDDLATKTERAWVGRLAGDGDLARKAAAEDVAALRAELLGPAPSATDKVLAGTVIVAHLAFQRAARAAAYPTDSLAVRAAWDKLLSEAQKRLQDAVRGWELYAGKRAKGVRPPGGIRLFEPDAECPQATDAGRPAASPPDPAPAPCAG